MAATKSMGKKSPAKKTSTAKKAQDEDRKYLCPYCNKEKSRTEFYMSSDPLVLTGITTMCKACAEKIARNWNEALQEYGDCTKISIQAALERLDKPWLEDIYVSSYNEVNSPDSAKRKTNVWGAYIKNISMVNYRGMRWRDGDIFATSSMTSNTDDLTVAKVKEMKTLKEEERKEIDINRKDVKRLIGYDPFANYPIEADKPLLYSQLINFIDDETKNDAMKMNAVVQIVQAFNQIQKINDAINELSSDIQSLNNNNGTIKQHAETISKLLSGANTLAKDNGISVNHNNSKSKGANTLTGKMKELELIGFRSAKINMYDVNYCHGMRQVAEISAKAQVDQIGFDENVMNEISNIRRELVDTLQKERDKAVERARLLLVENKDLKEFLKDKGLIDEFGQVIDGE
jgi:transcription elongation factor Elf1